MTPLAEELLNTPMGRSDMGAVREMLSGAQFFECAKLRPIYEIRNPLTPSEHLVRELLEMELPAQRSVFQNGDNNALLISSDHPMLVHGDRFACIRVLRASQGGLLCHFFNIASDGGYRTNEPDQEVHRDIARAIRWVAICIEAMQTPGFVHGVQRGANRQQARARQKQGKPSHKWVEIRLGRERQARGSTAGSNYKGVMAWHYRRGHRVNHPNPNYPKWRKGTWVGSSENGIRSHDYIVDPSGKVIDELDPGDDT